MLNADSQVTLSGNTKRIELTAVWLRVSPLTGPYCGQGAGTLGTRQLRLPREERRAHLECVHSHPAGVDAGVRICGTQGRARYT